MVDFQFDVVGSMASQGKGPEPSFNLYARGSARENKQKEGPLEMESLAWLIFPD